MITSIARRYPSFRDEPIKSVYRWLEGKRLDDGADGFWRIHDTLYDLSEFIDRHPGGPDWLRLTKGTDITEAFETHHIRMRAEDLLPKFKVGPAKGPRNVRLTFREDGFYLTLKRRVREELPKLDLKPTELSRLIIDSLLVVVFALAFASVHFSSYLVATICGLFISWVVISAHNFVHQRDNWRMKLLNLTFFCYREWRVTHILSHHFYSNSILDLEVSAFEPILCWLPNPAIKGRLQRFGSWIYGPLIFSAMFMLDYFKRIIETLATSKSNFYADDLVPFILPCFMMLVKPPTATIGDIMSLYFCVALTGSFFFGFIALNASHHQPECFHSGDQLPEDIDFGIFQLATIIDRVDVKQNHFTSLTGFGHHCLHHMFPTLDHGILPQLYPIFLKTCQDFGTLYRESSWMRLIIGQHLQLARISTHNTIPSDVTISTTSLFPADRTSRNPSNSAH
ncbi:cytochrome b5-related protein-like [Uranotaenia lowii]|uniref:cytochrome b5-related protein-like n=1 Tax=Uranotaenia lowii TaxID=190385 RepID=UPI002479293D|nr:cytochrome b5-related protein-like [Uranotaenia lowii]